MRRREFIAALGAVAMPVAAGAQQPAMPVVGFLRSAALAEVPHFATAFRNGLKETGFVEGGNVAVEYHSADDHHDRLVILAADLVRRPVNVIVANHNAALAAKAATTSVPIVFSTGSDPVRDGLVASLNRPGGSITGVGDATVLRDIRQSARELRRALNPLSCPSPRRSRQAAAWRSLDKPCYAKRPGSNAGPLL